MRALRLMKLNDFSERDLIIISICFKLYKKKIESFYGWAKVACNLNKEVRFAKFMNLEVFTKQKSDYLHSFSFSIDERH